ncbi:unnamed protein product [Xylocopa violacea]|uniref:Uncharacterized protein n=1 Tax=Xylocopa violacea TaxID=135666 RepID=A0ABP1NV46_XYLVO
MPNVICSGFPAVYASGIKSPRVSCIVFGERVSGVAGKLMSPRLRFRVAGRAEVEIEEEEEEEEEEEQEREQEEDRLVRHGLL